MVKRQLRSAKRADFRAINIKTLEKSEFFTSFDIVDKFQKK